MRLPRAPRALLRLVFAGLLVLPGACATLTPVDGFEEAQPLPDRGLTGKWQDVGVRLLAAGDLDRARKAFLRSLRVEGPDARTFSALGVTHERQGHLHEAERWFLRAKKAAPRSVLARNNLGVVYYKQGRHHLAKREFQSAIELSGGDSEIAATNLRRSEDRIAEERAAMQIPDVINHRLERAGSSEYFLAPIPPDDAVAAAPGVTTDDAPNAPSQTAAEGADADGADAAALTGVDDSAVSDEDADTAALEAPADAGSDTASAVQTDDPPGADPAPSEMKDGIEIVISGTVVHDGSEFAEPVPSGDKDTPQ